MEPYIRWENRSNLTPKGQLQKQEQPYDAWLSSLSEDKFHEYVAGRIDPPKNLHRQSGKFWTWPCMIVVGLLTFWTTVAILAYEYL